MPDIRDTRNLPAEVLSRLGAAGASATDPRWTAVTVDGKDRQVRSEARGVTDRIELRSSDGSDPTLTGYATVYGVEYDVWGGPDGGGWTEVMAAGACSKSVTERDDVRLLLDHYGLPLARTKSGTLELTSDGIGLRVDTPRGLDRENPDVRRLVSAMTRGDLDEMSLAFRVTRQEWNDEYTHRTVRELSPIFDVSVVTYPANAATVVMLRSAEPDEPGRWSVAYAKAQQHLLTRT